MVIEFGEQDSFAFDEVMEVLKRYLRSEHLSASICAYYTNIWRVVFV